MKIITKTNVSMLKELVRSDFKIRYQGSFLGYAWTLFRPLFMFGILYFVFNYVFKLGKGIPNYPVYLLLGIVLWNFMVETTVRGSTSIVENGGLLRKINIPKYIPVLASSISSFMNLLLNLIVVMIFILISGITPAFSWIMFPFIVLELFAFSLGAAFFLSAVYVNLRDINYIWELIIQAGFYLTPIIYPISKAPQFFQKLLFINPMAQIIQDSRYSLIGRSTDTAFSTLGGVKFIAPYIIVIILIIFSAKYFRSKSKYFAEDV